MVWYGMGMVWYGMVWYGMVWYGMVWYGMVRYGMVWQGYQTANITYFTHGSWLKELYTSLNSRRFEKVLSYAKLS